MKIVIATPLYPPEIGGPATYAKALEEEFPKRGTEVSLVKFGDVRHLPKGLAHAVYFFRVLRAAKSADVIYALDVSSAGFPAAVAAFMLKKPFVVKIVGDYAWEQGSLRFGVKELLDDFVKTPSSQYPFFVRTLRGVQYFIARTAKRIIVPSEYLKRIVSTWGIDSGKIVVVYNAFEGVAVTEKAHAREELALAGKVLFSAGRLVPWKGFGTLIALMPKIVSTFPECVLYIAGSGPGEKELIEMIDRHALRGRVVLLGDLPRPKLLLFLAAADCFILNTGYEGLSHQLLEAMAARVPIVTTTVGGNPELIEHKNSGLMVPYDNSEELFTAITYMLTNTQDAKEMSLRAAHFAESFSRTRMVDGTIAVLQQLLTSRP